jgi:hypothetical protein
MASEPENANAMAGRPPESSLIIGLGGPSEEVIRYQLAARWAERFSQPEDDLRALLDRFRQAYAYLDAVSHGLEPPAE